MVVPILTDELTSPKVRDGCGGRRHDYGGSGVGAGAAAAYGGSTGICSP
jgi:hypothetical protein